ncbi:MAG: class I SAM-dependent methyltransferase [Myxococcus sp.]|nr:class I SAM-dependent methyltransferase [Myxococcus sp.]
MPDYQEIYANHADRYEALVSHEDHEGHLSRALAEVAPGTGLRVVETGAGTGRLTRLFAPRSSRVDAFDGSAAMMAVARATFAAMPHVQCGVALHQALPVPDASADVGVEGWAFGHALSWNAAGWQADVRAWVAELERVVRPGGVLVLIETMGTGVEAPFEGGHSLEPFHAFVLDALGFSHRALRTDYAFASVDEAAQTLGFFFGERLAERVRAHQWRVVPECTGLYWRAR